jgi:hypothetical protein
MASGEFQIQIEKCHLETRTLVIAHFALCPESNVGTVVVMNIHSVFEVFGRATERLTAVVALEREGIKKGNSDRVAAYIYRRWDE